MTLDAVLAYLHYMAIFVLFAFLTAEAMLLLGPLDGHGIRLVARSDIGYAGSAVVALATGLARMYFGAKGAAFYLPQWAFHAKVAMFVVVALLSIKPTIAFIRWRRAVDRDAAWRVPPDEQARMRRLVMIEVHLAAAIPVFAVIMARGLG